MQLILSFFFFESRTLLSARAAGEERKGLWHFPAGVREQRCLGELPAQLGTGTDPTGLDPGRVEMLVSHYQQGDMPILAASWCLTAETGRTGQETPALPPSCMHRGKGTGQTHATEALLSGDLSPSSPQGNEMSPRWKRGCSCFGPSMPGA